MELRHLRYFAAVAENLSFRRAADRLHLTRPALSKQIRELEEELGVRLLERTTARISLTAAGQVYLQEVRELLAHTERAAELAREAARGKRGQLVIGEPGVIGLTFLTPVLALFREQFPHVEVTLKEIPDNQHPLAVESGDIQVGFALRGRGTDRSTLEHLPVLRLRVGVAMSRRHPLARRRSVSLGELGDQPILCMGDARTSEHAHYVRERFAALGLELPRIRLVSGTRPLMTMIGSGHGISLVPDALAVQGAGEVVVVPLEGGSAPLEFEMLAVWRREESSLLVKNFVRALRRNPRPPAD